MYRFRKISLIFNKKINKKIGCKKFEHTYVLFYNDNSKKYLIY